MSTERRCDSPRAGRAPSSAGAAVGGSRFQTFGFVVLRRFFDARLLGAELDQALLHGTSLEAPGGGEIRFRYVPMMTAETPVSIALLDRLESVPQRCSAARRSRRAPRGCATVATLHGT